MADSSRFHGFEFEGDKPPRRYARRRPGGLVRGAEPPLVDVAPAAAGGVGGDGGEPPVPPDVARFLRVVLGAARLELGHYRPGPLVRRVPACLRAVRAADVAAATEAVLSDPARLAAAVDALVIGVTSFFRDPEVWHELGARVLPELVAGRDRVRVWSAASSDGAELYSVAALLDAAGALGRADLLGTDCRSAAVAAAARGAYPAAAADEVPQELRAICFQSAPKGVTIRPRLAGACAWAVADALAEPPAGPWDLILCRNMAIYLAPAASQLLWRRLAGVLAPGGVLVVGKAERPAAAGLVQRSACLYQKERAT